MLVQKDLLESEKESLGQKKDPYKVASYAIKAPFLLTENSKLWPQGNIPIFFDFDPLLNLSNQQKTDFEKLIYKACDLWAAHAAINCIRDLSAASIADYSFVLIVKVVDDVKLFCGGFGSACATYPSVTKERYLFIGPVDERNLSLVTHEIGHNLGLVHEHQRDDLNAYWDYSGVITSRPEYYSAAPLGTFLDGGLLAVSNLGYDPESVMHYPFSYSYSTGFVLRTGYKYLHRLNQHKDIGPFALTTKDYDTILVPVERHISNEIMEFCSKL